MASHFRDQLKLKYSSTRTTAIRNAILLGLTALVFTSLDAALPVQIDDPAYFYYAQQIARHPLDPYGFELIWYDRREPAMEVLAPLLVPYWWSLAIRLFGDQVVLWKIWLLPFSWLLFFSLFQLFKRFALGLEWEFTLLLCFSPAFLPSFNLMLDVPALALSLFGLVIFLLSCDRGSRGIAVLAGVLAGLAMQTKYTALLAPPTMLIYGWTVGKTRLAILAGAVAAGLFAGWEGSLFYRYGQSHFALHVMETGISPLSRYLFILPLFSILGGVAPGGALVNLWALGVRRRWILATACLGALGYALVTLQEHPGPVGLIFGSTGVLIGVSSCLVARRLLTRLADPVPKAGAQNQPLPDRFLVLWMVLEVIGYFVLNPFAAVRRVLGLLVAGSMVTGRLAATACLSGRRRAMLRVLVAGNAVLGLVFYAIDWRDAQAEKEAVAASLAQIGPAGTRTIWYVGHWGFQFYAEQAGMKPVNPGESRLAEGDWLVIPDARIVQQALDLNEEDVEKRAVIAVEDRVPVGIISCFYGGATPLKHVEGPRLEVTVYRIRHSFLTRPLIEGEN
jgi:hypothetical protein